MKKTRNGILGAATAALLFAFASAPAMADEEFGGLPPGEGQDIVYFSCQGCHSLAIVQRSEFSRRVWDEVLEWMVDTHGMAPLPDDLYDVVLDYLVEHFGYEN